MSRRDEITDRKGLTGNRVSHSKRRTKHVQQVNLQRKTFTCPTTGRKVRLRVTTNTLKTIAKKGLGAVLKKHKSKA